MLDPKEEARFAELRAICRELKVPAPPEIMIGLKVHEGGGLTFDDVQRGHSWTRNYWNLMFCSGSDAPGDGGGSFGAGYMSAKDVSGNVAATAGYTCVRSSGLILGGGFHPNTSVATSGIVVGTGDTAFSINQNALAAQIAHGNGAGNFSHTAMNDPTLSYDAGSKTWTIVASRIFNNNSGGSITVKETGLYTDFYCFNSSAKKMIERSVLDPTVAVANGAQLTVTYEISMDFSAID